jgi:predicted PurR-regulated permease PerM
MAILNMMASPSATRVLTVASLVLLVIVGLPLWRPLLLAAVLAGTLSNAHERLTQKIGARRSLSSALITVAVVLVLLLPLWLLCVLVIKEAAALIAYMRQTFALHGLPGLISPLPPWLGRWAERAVARWSSVSHDLPSELTNWSYAGQALGAAAGVVGSITHLLFMVALMLVALFFLLRDGPALIGWAETASPLPEGRLRTVLLELRRVSRSVLGAQLGSGLVQAAVATVGYAVSGVPAPLLFGVLSLAASFIPIGGVSLPGILLLMGRPGWAIFLAVWTTVGTGIVDNVLRPLLVRGGTHLHAALVFFALLGGLLAFGPIGIVIGPLALALFLTLSRILRREREGRAVG